MLVNRAYCTGGLVLCKKTSRVVVCTRAEGIKNFTPVDAEVLCRHEEGAYVACQRSRCRHSPAV